MTTATTRHAAIYCRVSSDAQTHASQEHDLLCWERAWATGLDGQEPAIWYRDKQSGRTMARPGWQRLEAELAAGRVSRIVAWRLDRLGRTARSITDLIARLVESGIGLVSIRDGLDIATPAGRLGAHILASVAAYEVEVSGERVRAGIAATRTRGVKWGGWEPGRRRVDAEQLGAARILYERGEGVAAIARATRLSRQTIYAEAAAQGWVRPVIATE